jgi:UDP-N-acetylglucosamine--dolichyl-phosphate N-acetylglucosaminephosphotransferase
MVFHSYLTIIIPAILAFAVTVITTLFLMNYMFESGVTAVDHNKRNSPTLPSGCGSAVAFGFVVGLLTYVFGSSFSFYISYANLEYIFATIIAVFLISFTGFIDDINVKRQTVRTTGMDDTRKGLKQWQKPLFTIVGAIPLMAINAGVSVIRVPFLGAVNFGVLYPLVIIPLAVIFASNAFNLLGGFDGISTGSGLIASLALLAYALIYGSYTGALIAGVLSAALLAFLLFNLYPAKLVPGDAFTYAVGTGLVAAMILGQMEAFGVIVFMPWIIEFLLHLRKRFDVTDLGKLQSNGTFRAPYGKRIYSWTHLIMNLKRCKEWEVSLYMWLICIGFVALAFAMKYLALL